MTRVPDDQVKAETMARFNDKGPDHINCAQAMVDFAMGVLASDRDIIAAARYLGGGVGGMGGTCGAITGSALALGLRDYFAPSVDSDAVASAQTGLKELIYAFEQEFGACTCRELTGHDIRSPEGLDAFRKSEAAERCPLYIEWMCDHLSPMLLDREDTAPLSADNGQSRP